MGKTITFGSNTGILITDRDDKKDIINYLFNTLDLSKYRYNILNNLQRLKFLKQNKHYASPNFRGYNYLIIFKKINGKNYAVAIDRRKLKYKREQIDMNKVFIVSLKINPSQSIFRGTIFDGKLINIKKNYVFLIQDCYYLMGNNFISTELKQKMQLLDDLLNNQFSSPNKNFTFKINKLYDYEELHTLVNETIKKCTIPCQGLIFYPKFSGITMIYIEKKNDKIEISNEQDEVNAPSYQMFQQLEKYLKQRKYSYEAEGKKKNFWLKITDITDVYEMSESKNGDKLDIVHIPNLKTSHLCYNVLKDGSKKEFNCIFYSKFKKWIPLKEAYC
jgi:hypothetical protein